MQGKGRGLATTQGGWDPGSVLCPVPPTLEVEDAPRGMLHAQGGTMGGDGGVPSSPELCVPSPRQHLAVLPLLVRSHPSPSPCLAGARATCRPHGAQGKECYARGGGGGGGCCG